MSDDSLIQPMRDRIFWFMDKGIPSRFMILRLGTDQDLSGDVYVYDGGGEKALLRLTYDFRYRLGVNFEIRDYGELNLQPLVDAELGSIVDSDESGRPRPAFFDSVALLYADLGKTREFFELLGSALRELDPGE